MGSQGSNNEWDHKVSLGAKQTQEKESRKCPTTAIGKIKVISWLVCEKEAKPHQSVDYKEAADLEAALQDLACKNSGNRRAVRNDF